MENQRVRLSKTMLKNALIQLLKKKPIDKITIYELCEQAQINRTTFYKYYGSQNELLEEIENDLFAELERQLLASGGTELENLCDVFAFLLSEQEKCTVLINAVPDQEFTDKLFRLPAIRTLSEDHMPPGISQRQKEYLCLFVFQGAYAIIRKWLNDTNRESPEEVARLILTLSLRLAGEEPPKL